MKNTNVVVTSDFGPLIINLNDRFVGRSVTQIGYWALDDVHMIKNILSAILSRKDRVVFYDVGANIGTHSLALAKIFGEKIKIRAFEAQRPVFHMLCGTIALNGLTNVFCHHLAASDQGEQIIEVRLPDYNAENNIAGFELVPPVRSDNQGMLLGETDRVTTVMLDSFADPVDFIKIDIEGMEDSALRGARRLIAENRPALFVEIAKTDTQYILDMFGDLSYFGYQKADDLLLIPKEWGLTVNGLPQII